MGDEEIVYPVRRVKGERLGMCFNVCILYSKESYIVPTHKSVSKSVAVLIVDDERTIRR